MPAVEPGPRTLRFPVTLTVRAHPNEALDGVARYHVEWGRSSRLKLRGAEEVLPGGVDATPDGTRIILAVGMQIPAGATHILVYALCVCFRRLLLC